MKKRTRKRTGLDLTKPVERPRMPFGVMFRMFLIGSIAVCAAGYAIYRHYYVPRPSMVMPVPAAGAPPVPGLADSHGPDPAPSDVVPAPEIVPLPPSR